MAQAAVVRGAHIAPHQTKAGIDILGESRKEPVDDAGAACHVY